MTEKGQLTASFEVASRVPRNIVSLNWRILDSRFVMYRIEFKKGNDRMGSGGLMKWTMVIVVARADVFARLPDLNHHPSLQQESLGISPTTENQSRPVNCMRKHWISA